MLIVILAVLAAGLLMTGGLTVYLTITRERGRDVTPAAPEATDMRDRAQVGSTDEEITTQTRSSDGMVMVYVPASEFKMESSDEEVDAALEMYNTYYGGCERAWFEVEQPVHIVALDGFWIDQTEVTNGQ